MSLITSSLRQLEAAPANLPGLLDASLLAFEDLLTEIRSREDPASPLFAALTMAAVSAADGRDAVLFAPSLPLSPEPAGPPSQAPGQASDPTRRDIAELAALCTALTSRLDHAARSADVPGDYQACRDAARCARDIHDLLAGTRP
jgi:hypothetical protein